MIKRVLILSAGAAAGWIGHTAYSRGRQAVGDRAEQAVRDSVRPENLGEQLGQMAASALAASARGFASQLRDEVPSWRTAGEPRQAHPSVPEQGGAAESLRGDSHDGESGASGGPSATDPDAQRRAAERRAQMQERMKDIAASTDWRAVAEAAASRNWRGAASSFISTGLTGPRRTPRDETIPGTVTDPSPSEYSNRGDRKQS